ncbi:MAG: hypothetical protein AAGA65_02395 [Actinomycetota bacterium]
MTDHDRQSDDRDQPGQDPADDQLLATLRDAVLSSDQPPARLRDAALRALTWDTDMETLLATFDSATEAMAMRSTTVARDLTYELEGVAEVAVTVEDQDETMLSGSVDPSNLRVTLIQPGQPDRDLNVDQHGRFQLPVTGSVAGLVITTAEGRQLRTELFSLDPSPSDG